MRPDAPPLLDERARAEAEAAVEAAQGGLGRARAEVQRARATLELATSQLARERELDRAGLTTRQAVESREADVRTATEGFRAAEFAVAAASADLERARARVVPSGLDAGRRELAIAAPVSGVVLRRFRESEGVVTAGEPLVEIGDRGHLEIVSDLLSTDAVRVQPGMRVIVGQWGGDRPLPARVRRVEPSGFTKVSALGVEEQRVNVIVDFDDEAEAARALGDAYRVEVRIVIWEAADVIKIPTSALFRVGERWVVYVVEAGRARMADVELGQRTGQEAEVRSGLQDGQVLVIHPPDTLRDGARITERPQ
jgi:HlyD family secretion protein